MKERIWIRGEKKKKKRERKVNLKGEREKH